MTSIYLPSESMAQTLLQMSSFSRCEIYPTPDNFFLEPITIDVGLTAILLENPNSESDDDDSGEAGFKVIIPYDEFCTMVDGVPGVNTKFKQYLQAPAEQTCGNCFDAQPRMVVPLLLATLALVPSLFVNCTRMYPSTDMNCQKFQGLFLLVMSIVCSMVSYLGYSSKCLRSTFWVPNPKNATATIANVVSLDRYGNQVESDAIDEVVRITYDWTVGYGAICLLSAIGLMFLIVFCQVGVPTPTITFNTYEQKIYEQKVRKQLGLDKMENEEEEEEAEEDRKALVKRKK
eukprot:Nitzschia sp. Nitz4//scaffold26_size159584//23498//24364//NITZ4_002471-RA/size159584-processed-gene-0.15-mRNA-1//1//CDS//3329545022//2859//frame0